MAGSARIGALHVMLGLDSADFQAGMAQSERSLFGLSKTAQAAFVAVGVAVAAAAAAITVAVKGSIDHFDTLSKTSQKIGIPVEALSRLEYAAQLSDVSLESLATGMKKLSQNMVDVQAGAGSTALRGFDALGVSVKNADGTLKTSQSVLGEIADRFRALPDGVQKTAAAVAIFGRAGAELIPLLNGGSAGLKDMADEADRFGQTVSDSAAKQAEVFNDNLTRLGFAVSGMANSLATLALPALVAFTDALVQLSQHTGDIVPYLAVASAALAGLVAPALIASIGAVSSAIGVGMVAAVRALTAAMMANPLGLLIAGIAAAVTAAFVFRDQIKQAVGIDFVGVVADATNKVIGAFVGGFEAIKATWSLLPSAIGDLVYQAAESTINGVIYLIRQVQENFNLMMAGFDTMLVKFGAKATNLRANFLPYADVSNPYAGAAGNAGQVAGDAFNSAMSVDYIGQMAGALSTFTTSADGAAASVAGLNNELDGNGGGGAAKGATNSLKNKLDATKKSSDELGGSLKDAFKGFITDIKDGKGWLESLGSALNKVADKLLDMALDGLFNIFSAGGGGGIFGAIGSLFGIGHNANGTNNWGGGLTMVGERGPELVNLPSGSQVIPNSALGGSSMKVAISLDNALLRAVVTDEAGRVVGQASPAIVGASVNQANKSAPGAMARYQNDQAGSDYRL